MVMLAVSPVSCALVTRARVASTRGIVGGRPLLLRGSYVPGARAMMSGKNGRIRKVASTASAPSASGAPVEAAAGEAANSAENRYNLEGKATANGGITIPTLLTLLRVAAVPALVSGERPASANSTAAWAHTSASCGPCFAHSYLRATGFLPPRYAAPEPASSLNRIKSVLHRRALGGVCQLHHLRGGCSHRLARRLPR